MKIKCWLLIFLLNQVLAVAQACGSGVFTLEIKSDKNESLAYEILQIQQEFENLVYNDFYQGYLINQDKLKTLKIEAIEVDRIPSLKNQAPVSNSNVKENTIAFKTIETGYYVHLLKIKTKKKEIYMLANLFGGCNRKTTMVLDEKVYLIKH